LGWVNKDAKLRVTNQCKIIFSTSENYIDEVEVDVGSFDVIGVVFGSPYMYMRDVIFTRRENRYHQMKYGNSIVINEHKGKFYYLFVKC
jgi:hypothetical protein